MARQSDRDRRAVAASGAGVLDSLKSTGFWSAVGAAVGIAAIVIGAALYVTVDELRDIAVYTLTAGLVLLFVALALSPRAVAIFMAGRQGRWGANVAIMTAAFFVIVILVNFLLFRTTARFDVTSTRVFSLAQQTRQVLDGMDSPVRANAFFIPNDPTTAFQQQQAEDLLNEFARRSSNFTYRFIDPELNRTIAVQYDVTDYPVIVFEDLETFAQQSVFAFNQQEFVTGILVSTGEEQKHVYHLTGHEEASLTRDPATGETDDDGFDFALQGMQRDNYRVLPLNLVQDGAIPQDAAVVIVPGPKRDLSDAETQAFMDYLIRGGKAIFMLDPDAPDSYRALLLQWGVQVGTTPVADLISNVAGEPTTPMLQRANSQFVSGGLTGVDIANQLDVAFFSDATAVLPALPPEDMPTWMQYKPIGHTTPASWLETNPEEVSFDIGDDVSGQFDIAAAMEAGGTLGGRSLEVAPEQGDDTLAKLVVFGDSDFARNKFFFSSDNSNLMLNSVNWLAGDYNLISIREPFIASRPIIVNSRERDFIQWSSWFLPPLVMLVIGVAVWWRRR